MSQYLNLTSFTAYRNNLSFNLTEFCSCTKLTSLTLTNQLNIISPYPQSIPTCLATLANLKVLSLTSAPDSAFVGSINGVNYTSMTQLQTLYLYSNAFGGVLPNSMPSSLTSLTFGAINITTSLSSVTWATLPLLTTLQLLDLIALPPLANNMSNAIPVGVTTLGLTIANIGSVYPLSTFSLQRYTALKSLTIINLLTGTLSNTMQNLTNLQTLNFGHNQLSGSLDVIDWGRMGSLVYLLLNDNSFNNFGNAFNNTPSLQQLYIRTNINLTGTFSPYLLNSTAFNQM
jgi:hypothetical protein